MNGVFQAGGVFGTLALSWVADKWGRKAAIAIVSLCGL
jgi:MFS family permease